jgi:hypothetical protein
MRTDYITTAKQTEAGPGALQDSDFSCVTSFEPIAAIKFFDAVLIPGFMALKINSPV